MIEMNYGNENAAMRQDKQANYQGGATAEGGYSPGGLSGGSMLGETKRQPEATRYVNELEKNLTHCEASLNELIERLGRVLRSDSPTVGNGLTPAPREVTQTALGGAIQEQADRAAALSGRIRQITSRLEV